MSSLVEILRDMYVRTFGEIANRKLQEYIGENCIGCREPGKMRGKHHHNICELMSWDDQVIDFLPDILEKITPGEISKEIRTTYKYEKRRESLKNMLLRKHQQFSLRTFLYICYKDMKTDVLFQTRIARDVYTAFFATDKSIRNFEENYQKAITPKIE